MKRWMATAATFALLTGLSAANAQNAPANTNTQPNTTMQQPSSQSSKPAMSRKHHASRSYKMHHRASLKPRYTTGAGRTGSVGGPRNDPSIHQSIQRDSRGTPKGTGPDQNK